jgi:hypothetical protein
VEEVSRATTFIDRMEEDALTLSPSSLGPSPPRLRRACSAAVEPMEDEAVGGDDAASTDHMEDDAPTSSPSPSGAGLSLPRPPVARRATKWFPCY